MVGKKIKGRKRHIVVDTQGNILHVVVHAANIHDTIAGCKVLREAVEKYPTIRGISADEGYRGTTKDFVEKMLYKNIDISKKISPGWSLLPQRWIVERTLSWFNGYRRLSKDFELEVSSAKAFIMIAHSAVLIKRF